MAARTDAKPIHEQREHDLAMHVFTVSAGICARLALGMLLVLAAGMASAASVIVSVHDTQGLAMGDVNLRVQPRTEDGRVDRSRGYLNFFATTDLAGHASISVPPGRWRLDASSRGSLFVAPSENPRHPPIPIDIISDTSVVEAELVLSRGGRVRANLECNREAPAVAVSFESLDGLWTREVSLRESTLSGDIALLPGRWRVHAVIPPGWLLVGLSVDGQELSGSDTVISIEEADDRIDVVVRLEGMAWIGGGLGITGPSPCIGEVSAVLVEPGPWLAAAAARGGSEYRVVLANKHVRPCSWDAILPSGTWRIEVNCGKGCVVSPALPLVTLAPGEQRTLDIQGSVSPAGQGDPPMREVIVTVLTPEGKAAVNARLKAWPLEASESGVEPMGIARTNRDGIARLLVKGITGALRIVAGHPDHLDGEAVTGDPVSSSGWPPLTITLAPSASLDVVARDAEERAIAGVRVQITASREPADLITFPPMRALRRSRDRVTDAEGALSWLGLPGGDWAVAAHLAGGDANAFLMDVTGEGFTPDEDDATKGSVRLTEGSASKLAIRIRPAARIIVSLDPSCEPFPREMELRVVPASLMKPGAEDVEALLDHPYLQVDRMPRGGLADSEIMIGPLATGSWIVAVRPDGFDRWTLAPGVEVLPDAAGVEALEGSIARVPSFRIDCAPLLELIPKITSGAPTPDMRLARVSATWTRASVPESPPITLVTRSLRDSVRAERIPEGRGVASIRIFHPHGLPEPKIEVRQEAKAERGKRVRVVVEWSDLGGAVAVGGRSAYIGARSAALAPSGEVAPWRRIVPVVDSHALVPSLSAGDWIVADCDDAACASAARERHARVEAGKTTMLE